MKELSRKAMSIHPSATLQINNLYKQLKAEGKDALGFGVGEPDFNTPDNIKEAGIKAIRENQTHYTPAAGNLDLRKAICYRLDKDCGVRYEPNEICVASGAKHSLFITLMCILNPGDEVILPGPFWVSYYEMINMAGGVPIIVGASADDDFKISPAQLRKAISKKTKAVILNNPSNPTGMFYSGEELKALCDVCVESDLYIISDEIYYCLIYDNKEFVSVASLGRDIRDHTILVNGVSKAYAMTGWRIGYTACNDKLTSVMSNYLSHSTSAPSTISQCAAVEALLGQQESVGAMRAEFEKRRNYMTDRMSKIAGIKFIKPEGAFYIMMDVGNFVGKTIRGHKITSSEDFATAFVKEEMVAVVPGYSFGAEHYIRWSYATDMDSIKKAMDRLERFVADAK